MKKLLVLLIFILFSCKQEEKIMLKYKGSNGKENATLSIIEEENRFYGTYEVFYDGNEKVKDSGKVSGEKIGDTLKGKFVYISYGGGESIKPFVILKSDKNYRVGSGVTGVLLGVPHYLPGTISFPNENLLLQPLNNK